MSSIHDDCVTLWGPGQYEYWFESDTYNYYLGYVKQWFQDEWCYGRILYSLQVDGTLQKAEAQLARELAGAAQAKRLREKRT